MTKNCRKYVTPIEYHGNLPQRLKICPLAKNLISKYGGKEIHPHVLQDIDPLRPLPCSHSTSSADLSEHCNGYC